MRLASTTGDFDFYCNTYQERVQHLYEAGFRYIDLCMYTTFPEDELLGKTSVLLLVEVELVEQQLLNLLLKDIMLLLIMFQAKKKQMN